MVAMSKARLEHPNAFAKYQSAKPDHSDVEELEKRRELLKNSSRDFETLISEIAARDGITKADAWARAREEHPREFERFQNA